MLSYPSLTEQCCWQNKAIMTMFTYMLTTSVQSKLLTLEGGNGWVLSGLSFVVNLELPKLIGLL